jgi:hypothetical protein
MNDEMKDLAEIMQEEHEKQVAEWTKAKEELNGLIEPKYFDFAESHESYGSEGIVNIIEVKEKTSRYSAYPLCREFGSNERRIYIHHTTQLETEDEQSKYEGSDIEYWVWQTVGYCEDDYSGFLLLPMLDGRYWKISYSC